MQAFERAARQLPGYIAHPMLALPESLKRATQEIRLYRDGYAAVFDGRTCRFLCRDGGVSSVPCGASLVVDKRVLEEAFLMLCGYSMQTHEYELAEGYITTANGDRVGVGFSAAYSPEGRTVRDATSLNVRISREILSSGRDILEKVYISNGILIAGAPCSGKTTLLRDIVRRISSGLAGDIRKLTVIDERFEISSGKNLGLCTDVIAGVPKARAIRQAVRTLSPQLIACDEIGSLEEAREVCEGLRCGVAFIATAHCGSEAELCSGSIIAALMETQAFGSIALLAGAATPGIVRRIIGRDEYYDKSRRAAAGIHGEHDIRLCTGGGAFRGAEGTGDAFGVFPAVCTAAAEQTSDNVGDSCCACGTEIIH